MGKYQNKKAAQQKLAPTRARDENGKFIKNDFKDEPMITSYAVVRGDDGLWTLLKIRSQGRDIREVTKSSADHRVNIMDRMFEAVDGELV